jgi:hypothetical protein
MAIARKPTSKPAAPQADEAAERFIAAAGVPLAATDQPSPAAQSDPESAPDGDRRQPAMIRFDRALLARVDRAAKRRGISRSAWIQYTVSRVLDEEEG